MARHYPDCGHVRPKGDRHRRCVTCLGRDHAEGALSGKAPVCSICASLPLAKATRRLAFWKRKDAEETALVPSGADAPVRMSASSALDLVSVSSRLAAAAPLPGLSPSPPPVSPGAAGSEAEELQPSGVQPELELDISLDDDSLLDFSDEHSSIAEAMQTSHDVRMRVETPPTSSRLLGQQLHEVALRAASCLGLPLPPPPSVRSSLLDGEFYAGSAASVPSCIPFFEEVHEELQATWAIPYSGRAPVPGFAPYMQLHMAKERGYLSFPQVEDAVAGYLSPASPTMRLGQKPLLPTRVGRHQAQLAEKSYLAAGQAACTTNTAALLQRYQAKLLTELALSLGEDHPSVAELRRATDLSLRLTRCTAQALGRVMGAAVATQRSLWLSLAKLSDREKAPLLDAPVSVQGAFGEAVVTMAAKFEEQQKSREVFQAWMPRSSGTGETSSSGHTTPAPGQKRSGFRSPAPPAKVSTGRGWQRHPFRPPAQPAAQRPAARPAQGAAQAPRQHSARRGRGRGRPQAS